eukprot:700917-Amorphochlora_amoeboformis.AAC.1
MFKKGTHRTTTGLLGRTLLGAGHLIKLVLSGAKDVVSNPSGNGNGKEGDLSKTAVVVPLEGSGGRRNLLGARSEAHPVAHGAGGDAGHGGEGTGSRGSTEVGGGTHANDGNESDDSHSAHA